MSLAPPNSIESQEFLFKALCRLRIFPSQTEQFKSAACLVASAPKYGFVFVGVSRGFQVLQSNKIAELALSSRYESTEYPRREVNLNASPSHLSVSCDQTYLAVGVVQDTCASAYVYDITKFCSRTIPVLSSIRLATTPGCVILDLHFNPGIPNLIAACTSDGGVGVYEMKGTSIDVNTLPPATQATCLCWSPKGKQLVIGDKNGALTQYKPDLKQVKSYPPPSDKQSWSLVNVLWVSNYQFVAVYADPIHPEERPCIMVVNVPKGGPISYINYEDICYSAGELRPPQYYLLLQGTWNVLMVASANSMEVGVLALLQDQVSWQQWTQEDAARAELPLTQKRQETYPVGMALDTSSIRQLPWGENQSLQPMPLLHILSHDGVLCIYHVINILPGAAGICSPPQPVNDMTGLDQFIHAPAQPPPVEPPQPSLQSSQQPPQPTVPTSVPPVPSFQQPPSVTPSFGSSSGFFASSAPVTPTVSGPPSTSSSGFCFSGVLPAASGDTGQRPTGSILPSNGALAFQPPQPSVPAVDTSRITSAPKALPPLVPIPPVEPSQPHVQQQEVVNQEELSTGVTENGDNKGESIDPAMYVDLIQAEIRDLQNELSKLKQGTQGFAEIGTKDEKEMLLHKGNILESFVKDLKETTKSQSNEIAGLQSLTMETFSWVEDAKSRHQQLNDPSYLQLVRAQELDLASKRRMSNIQQMQFYVENQLHEVGKHLDCQWGEFQDSLGNIKNRLYIPTMEEVYQTMVTQNKILAKQQCILEDVSQRTASHKIRNSNRIPLISDSALTSCSASRPLKLQTKEGILNNNRRLETDLSSLAVNLLEMKLRSRQSEESDLDSVLDIERNLNISRSRHALASQKLLTPTKIKTLRERLMQVPMVHIKPDRTPSEMRTIGERPCISFTSAVLPILSRKAKKIDEVKKTPSPSSSAAKTTVAPGVIQHRNHSLLQPALIQDVKTTGSGSNLAIPTAQKTSFSSSPVSTSGQTSGIASGKLQIISNASSTKNAVVFSSVKPSSTTGAIQTPSVQTTNNLVQTGTQGPLIPKASSTSEASPLVSSSNVKANVIKTVSSSVVAPSLTLAVASKPEAVKQDFSKPVIPTTTQSELTPIFKVPHCNSQPAGFSFSFATSTPKSNDKAPFPTLAKPHTTRADAEPSSTTEGGKSPLASLGNLIENLSAASNQPAPPPPKTLLEAAPSTLNPSAAFAASVTPKQGESAPKTTGFSFQGANAFAPSQTSSSTSSFFGSGFGVTSSNPSLAPTQPKSSTPSLFTPSATVGSVTITPITVPASTQPASAAAAETPSSVTIAPAVSAAPAVTSTSATTLPSATSVDGSSSLFGGLGLGGAPVATNKSPASIFGGSSTATGASPLFGSPASSTGLVITSVSGAASASPAKSLLGTPASAAPTSSFSFGTTPLFGGSTTTAASTTPISSATSSGLAPLFGQVLTTSASTPAPVVSAATPNPTFGQEPTTSTVAIASGTAPSAVFGQTPTVSAATPSASVAAPSTLFGQALATPAASSAPATVSTAPSALFGQAQPIATSAPVSSSFSFVPSTTAPPPFGAVSSSFSFATPASTTAPTTSSSASFTFALPATTTGSAVSSSKSFSFVSPPASTSTTPQPVFGSTPAPLFGQAATSTPATFFGQQICSPSSPGQSASIFGGGSPSVASTGFSQPATTAQSIFAPTPSMGAFGSKPTFGQSGGSLFGASPGSTTGFSASGTSMFGGGQPSGSSVFGGGATSPPTANPFHQSSASTPGSVFGSPPPSTGSFSGGIGNTIGQSGFGSSPSFQQPSQFGGFGSSSAFGSPPAFGSAPAFGGSPTFGGAPAFGSPSKVFGSSPTPGFGSASATPSNTTFEALATQDSGMTFGNLAQSNQQSPQTSNLFGGASSPPFGNTGSSFGGKSFSSWR